MTATTAPQQRMLAQRAHEPDEATPEDVLSQRRAIWQHGGIATLDPAEIRDEWLRQAVVNEAERLYGRRTKGAE